MGDDLIKINGTWYMTTHYLPSEGKWAVHIYKSNNLYDWYLYKKDFTSCCMAMFLPRQNGSYDLYGNKNQMSGSDYEGIKICGVDVI